AGGERGRCAGGDVEPPRRRQHERAAGRRAGCRCDRFRARGAALAPRMRRAAVAVVLLSALSALGGMLWRQRPVPAAVPDRPLASGSSAAAAEPPAPRARRLGGLDVTFIGAADTHFGFRATETDVTGKVRDPIREPLGSE